MQSQEEQYSNLVAIRTALQDNYDNELDIIRELKNYLLNNGESFISINEILCGFYQYFEINIHPSFIEQVSIDDNQLFNNIFEFMLNNYGQETPGQETPGQETPGQETGNTHIIEILFINQPMNSNTVLNNDHNHNYNHMINLLNYISNEGTLNSTPITNGLESIVVTLDDTCLENLKSIKLESTIDTYCSICMEQMNKDEMITNLKCDHKFHTECIKTYLTHYNYKCPVCRAEVGKCKYNLNPNTI